MLIASIDICPKLGQEPRVLASVVNLQPLMDRLVQLKVVCLEVDLQLFKLLQSSR